MEKFGEKLHMLRANRRLTLKELADALGYSTHSHISAIESGKKKPTVEFVVKVARLFDVSTDVLLKDELEITFEGLSSQSGESHDLSLDS